MKGAVIVNGFMDGGKYLEPAIMIRSSAYNIGVDVDIVPNNSIISPIGRLKDDPGILGDVDFVIFWDKDIELASEIESIGIPVFNSSECIRVCDNKSLTHSVLSRHGIPFPDTFRIPFSFRNIGYREGEYIDTIGDRLGYPLVLKDCFGSFGKQVRLIQDREDLVNEILSSNEPMIAQRYIECQSSDIRVEVVGGKVVEAVKRKGVDGDFRSNATLGGTMTQYVPSLEEEELAISASKAVGADFSGIDILQTRDGPVVCEVNSNAHITNLLSCTGHDVSVDILAHIMESL